MTFVVIHVAALTADKYVDFGLSQVLVPFAGRWRPGPVAWGIVALDLLVAMEATSLAMRCLPRKLWRKIHLLSFVLFAFSTVHAIQTGTDTANPLVRSVGLGLLATALGAAMLRVVRAQRRLRAGQCGHGRTETTGPQPALRDAPANKAAFFPPSPPVGRRPTVARLADPPPPQPAKTTLVR